MVYKPGFLYTKPPRMNMNISSNIKIMAIQFLFVALLFYVVVGQTSELKVLYGILLGVNLIAMMASHSIVSSFASTLVSFGFLGAMAWTGQ